MRARNSSNGRSIAKVLVATLVAAFCAELAISHGILSPALIPPDLRERLVAWLGGEIRTAPGGLQVEIPLLSMGAAVSVVTLILWGIRRLVCRSEEGSPADANSATADRLLGVSLTAAFLLLLMECLLLAGRTTEAVSSGRVLTVVLPMLAAFWCHALLFPTGISSRPAVRPSEERRSWMPLAAVLVMTVGWILVSYGLNRRLYDLLLIPHGDSAMYEEHLWNIRTGKGFRSYLDQGLFLGEHMQVIHLGLLPFHVIWPSHLMLELAESIALGSCTIPLYLIAFRWSGSRTAAALLAVSWLFCFPMHFLDIAVDQKSFRPIALALPFLFWLIRSAETGRRTAAVVCAVTALSAKEDLALTLIPLGLVLAVRSGTSADGVRDQSDISEVVKRRRFGIILAVSSLVWLLLSVLVLIPWFREGDVVHYSRYFGDLGSSPGDLVRTALTDPLKVLRQFFRLQTLFYVFVFAAPTGLLCFRRPIVLSASVLTFAMLSLLQFEVSDGGVVFPPVPYHHFHAPMLPIVFWAAAAALRTGTAPESGRSAESGKILGYLRRTAARFFPDVASPVSGAALVLMCSLSTGLVGSMSPTGLTFWSDASSFGAGAVYFPDGSTAAGRHALERAAAADRVVQMIPESARVASTDFIHTRLTHCLRSYDYSGYERRVNQGETVPPDTEYIVIDTGHRYSEIRGPEEVPELRDRPEEWSLLPDQTNGIFIVLRRRTNTGDSAGADPAADANGGPASLPTDDRNR